jgi:hypothetical protein
VAWVFSVDGTPNNSVNTAPATGARAVYTLLACLMQAGWTKVADSDGTTYSSGGTQVTSGASGAGGLGNNSAWVRMRDPAGVREFILQRGTTNLLWRFLWSHSAKFTGGSPGATQTPSATDEQTVNMGGGTHASPTFGTCFGTDNAYKFHCGADNAAPYDWWWVALDNTTQANPRRGWFLNMQSASYDSLDAAPYVIDFGGSGTSAFSTLAIKGYSYHKKGLAGETWAAYYLLIYATNRPGSSTQVAPSTNGSATNGVSATNPYSSLDDLVPAPLARDVAIATPGWKGIISMNTYAFGITTTWPALKVITAADSSKAFATMGPGGQVLRWPVGVSQSA